MSSALIVPARRDKSLTLLRERRRAYFTSASTINWRCARVTSERLSWGSLTPHTNTRDSPAESRNGTSPAPYHELSYHFIPRHVKSSFICTVIRRAHLIPSFFAACCEFCTPWGVSCTQDSIIPNSFLPINGTEISKNSLGIPYFLYWTSPIIKLGRVNTSDGILLV